LAGESAHRATAGGSVGGAIGNVRLSKSNLDSVKKLADQNAVGTAMNINPLNSYLTTGGLSGMHSTLRGTQQSNFMIGT